MMIDEVKIESNITTHKIKHIGASEYKTTIELTYPDGSIDRMFQVKIISEPIPDEPKFKVGEKVTITSNKDSWEDVIESIIDNTYYFKLGGYLSVSRQNVQLKETE